MFHAISSYFCLVLFCTCVLLSGCGIKPTNVILPDDKPAQQFPEIYPDPNKNTP